MKIITVIILFLAAIASPSDFKENPCLTPNIDFWEKIYTVYGKSQGVFHNKNTMEIYLVKTLPENKKIRSKIIDYTLDSLRKAHPGQEMRLQSGVKEQFEAGYKNAKKYIPVIREELTKHNAPEELAYLPFVESGFNPTAKSKVGALGMWQIMPQTGKIFGNKNKKNLYDPMIATGIAVKILKNNYKETGDWHLALMSYNHGVEGIKRAQSTLETSDYCIITENYKGKAFKFASKNFLSQFLAVRRIMQCRHF